MNEFERIRTFFAPLASGFPGALGLTDDAALLTPESGRELVVTTDAVAEGVHFHAPADPVLAAAKLLRSNLSDLASMGARPLAYVLNVVLPPHIGEDWLRRFAAALGEDQARFGIHLAGGDSIGVPEGRLVLSATLFGDVPAGGALRRGAAQEGDRIMLSGTIGDAWLGLQATESKLSNISDKYIAFLKQRFNFPEPRLTLGRLLVGTARAAVDVSDGLAADLGHICSASGLCAELALDAIPLSPAARAAVAAGASVLDLVSGGDDYELVFTLSPEAVPDAQAAAAECGVAITDIGHMTLGPAGHVILRDAKGRPINLARKGWQHA